MNPARQPARPTPEQLAWQRAQFGLFCHFGINTYYGREWSDGSLDPAAFDPSDFDADQWAATAVAAGARYLVLTAKHHDGFCLWPTETTSYSIAQSPWRAGKGDVVAEAARACERAGIGFGLYLSPWDRNAKCYQDPAAYDDFYCRQLTELCTRYGPLFEVWFDGAGSEGRTYDWDRIMSVVDEHQPSAMVFNMGRPTIRWIGNENGLATDPCFYAVSRTDVSVCASDRAPLDGVRYLPPECDVAIRRNWFWQPDDVATLKSVEHLLGIYYRSVGLGANLLLNVPPDRRGLLDHADRERLLDFAAALRTRFGGAVSACCQEYDGGTRAVLSGPTRFDHVVLHERLNSGQRIDGHEVVVEGVVVAAGRTVGSTRIHAFPPVTASSIEVRFAGTGVVDALEVADTGHSTVPALGRLQTADSDKAR